MIRIVHVISALRTGGAEMMLAKLVNGLDRQRFSNVVISLADAGPLKPQIEGLGVPVYSLGMKRGPEDIFALNRLVRLLSELKPTIVQSWLYHADGLSTVAAKLARLPVLIWNVRCSDMDLTKYRSLTRCVRWLLACCSGIPDAVIVNSVVGKRQHEQLGYRPKRWEIIPNGFDIERFRPNHETRVACRKSWGVNGDTAVIGLIARVDPMKDHETFFAAAEQTVRARSNVHFVLAGENTQTLREVVLKKGLMDVVHLLGYRNDMEALLPGIDICCLSSAFGEGFPNVIGEAMACGVPCVSTDVGDVRGIVEETGSIVPIRDADALAKALIDLIDRGPEERERLGRAARQKIETSYSLPTIVEKYAALYVHLARRAGCA